MTGIYHFQRGRLTLPPIVDVEWEDDPPIAEASDSSAKRRRQAALAAAKDVRASRYKAEKSAVGQYIDRLRQLRRELNGILSSATATNYRKIEATRLLAEVDGAIKSATESMLAIAKTHYAVAAQFGGDQVDQAIRAAGIGAVVLPSSHLELVTAAFDNTVDLLTEPMQQFRNRVRVQVRRLSTAGDSFGDQWLGLSKTIDEAGFDSAAFKAERILRTETSRTFSGATHQRLQQMATRMPFIRKIWIRVLDSRTRLTHVTAGAQYARGRGIAITEPFLVGAAKLMYPVDPNGEPAGQAVARETIMCRCSEAVDFDVAELAKHAASRVSVAFGS